MENKATKEDSNCDLFVCFFNEIGVVHRFGRGGVESIEERDHDAVQGRIRLAEATGNLASTGRQEYHKIQPVTGRVIC